MTKPASKKRLKRRLERNKAIPEGDVTPTRKLSQEEYLAWAMSFKAAHEYRRDHACRGPFGGPFV